MIDVRYGSKQTSRHVRVIITNVGRRRASRGVHDLSSMGGQGVLALVMTGSVVQSYSAAPSKDYYHPPFLD